MKFIKALDGTAIVKADRINFLRVARTTEHGAERFAVMAEVAESGCFVRMSSTYPSLDEAKDDLSELENILHEAAVQS